MTTTNTLADRFRNDLGTDRFRMIVYNNINKMMENTMFDICQATSSQDLLNEFKTKASTQEGEDFHTFLFKFISLYMEKLARK